MTTAGELKQDILRVYNAINKKIFNVGVKQQKVDFVGNKIIIVSRNSRVPVLKLLDENYPSLPGSWTTFISIVETGDQTIF